MSRIEEALRRAGDQQAIDLFEPLDQAIDMDIDADRFVRADQELPPPAPAAVPLEAADEPAPTPIAVRTRPLTNDKLIVHAKMPPIAVEQYRRLAVTLHKVHLQTNTRVVMITSTMAGEGKTLTASNLALALAESFDRRVLLVDADLRRPTIHEVFDLPNTRGLNDCLHAEEAGPLPRIDVSARLTVVTAGQPNPDPMRGLISDRMQQIVMEAAAQYDWVVLDTPPVGLLPDASLITDMVDMLVLVVGAGSTPLPLIERTLAALDRDKLVGVVLNRAAPPNSSYHYYQYYASPSRKKH